MAMMRFRVYTDLVEFYSKHFNRLQLVVTGREGTGRQAVAVCAH